MAKKSAKTKPANSIAGALASIGKSKVANTEADDDFTDADALAGGTPALPVKVEKVEKAIEFTEVDDAAKKAAADVALAAKTKAEKEAAEAKAAKTISDKQAKEAEKAAKEADKAKAAKEAKEAADAKAISDKEAKEAAQAKKDVKKIEDDKAKIGLMGNELTKLVIENEAALGGAEYEGVHLAKDVESSLAAKMTQIGDLAQIETFIKAMSKDVKSKIKAAAKGTPAKPAKPAKPATAVVPGAPVVAVTHGTHKHPFKVFNVSNIYKFMRGVVQEGAVTGPNALKLGKSGKIRIPKQAVIEFGNELEEVALGEIIAIIRNIRIMQKGSGTGRKVIQCEEIERFTWVGKTGSKGKELGAVDSAAAKNFANSWKNKGERLCPNNKLAKYIQNQIGKKNISISAGGTTISSSGKKKGNARALLGLILFDIAETIAYWGIGTILKSKKAPTVSPAKHGKDSDVKAGIELVRKQFGLQRWVVY